MNPSPAAATFAPYQSLLERTLEIALLQGAAALLSWDQQTYMPPKAIDFRADQLGYFSGRAHRLFTSPEVGGWIQACEDASFGVGANDGDAAATNIRQWRYEYDRATRLPVELVENFQRGTSARQRGLAGGSQTFGFFDVCAASAQHSEFEPRDGGALGL